MRENIITLRFLRLYGAMTWDEERAWKGEVVENGEEYREYRSDMSAGKEENGGYC